MRVGRDHVLAPVGVEDDLGLEQRGGVILEAPDFYRLRRHEAMAVSRVARHEFVDREGDGLDRVMGDAEGAQDRAQRAHPAQRVGPRRGRAPAHRFRPGKGADDRRQNLGEKFARRPAGLVDRGDVELALLGVLLDLRIPDSGEPGALEEPSDRALGRADARPLALLAPMRLQLGQADDMQRQPARRREALRALVGHVGLDERVGDEPLQVVRRLALHARRDFFAEEFKDEVGHSRSSLDNHLTTVRLVAPPLTLPLPARGESGRQGAAHSSPRLRGEAG